MNLTLITRLLLLLLIGTLPALAQNDDILRPEKAFQYVVTDTGSALEIDWAIADGYYLYRNKLSFDSATAGVRFLPFELPEGRPHEDEFFGTQQVYRERFYVTIPYETGDTRPAALELVTRSQGCADLGICYPPQSWTTTVELVANNNDAASMLSSPFAANSTRSALGDFLPVDEAFIPHVIVIDGNTVEVSWEVANGYYLYKDKLAVTTKSTTVQLGRLELPPGKPKTDEYFGETEVYLEDVFARLPLARATPEPLPLTLDLSYQGCAENGICYPPVSRSLSVNLPEATAVGALAAAGGAPMVSEQARLAGLIGNASLLAVIATFFGAGLLLAFTPCVLPMIPILSGIIAGDGDNVSPARGFSLALSYVMGMALIYTAAGIAAAAVGVQLQAVFNAPWVLTLFAALFVVLALGMFGLYDLQMPTSIQTRLAGLSGRQKSGTLVGAFVMGALSSLIVTACVAPPLVATLTVIGQTGDVWRGGTALFALSLGMGAPLLAVGASAGRLLPKSGPWMVAIKDAFGFMMLGLAIWMLSRILPDSVTLLLWGVLVVMAGVWLGGLTSLAHGATGMQKLAKGSGLIALIYGAALLLGALSGAHDPLQPLARLGAAGGAASVEEHGLDFQRIKTVEDLDKALANAAQYGKTAMLDFYADWCVSCIEMEKYTFTDADVQAVLADSVLLQADVTANDAADQALLQRFGVFGPPTIIFFDSSGQQRHGYEVVGYMKAAAFAAHVARATGAATSLTANSTQSEQ